VGNIIFDPLPPVAFSKAVSGRLRETTATAQATEIVSAGSRKIGQL
jgi:hypothetical protein